MVELNVPRHDQILGDDHALASSGIGTLGSTLRTSLAWVPSGLVAGFSGADLDAGDPHVITRVDAGGRE